MRWKFEHLPEYQLENLCAGRSGKRLLINSNMCFNQESRPCKDAGRCCLGTKKDCGKNKCPNNKKIRYNEEIDIYS